MVILWDFDTAGSESVYLKPDEIHYSNSLVRSLPKWTTQIYPEAKADREKIMAEHEAIKNAVLAGLPDEAAEKMRVHLKQHNSRVIKEALSETT